MKKNTLKAFTLVEMLIVIVIIGILIAALLPRMQAAQWRARDVSRKTALSQIQSAIVTYQWDHGRWPKVDSANWTWISVDSLETELLEAWMNEVPKDPLWNSVNWIWDASWSNYLYMVWKRNGAEKWWFILMAKTEVAGWSNWVLCDGTPQTTSGKINTNADLKDIHPCTSLTKDSDSSKCWISSGWKCTYTNDWELRYILVY